MTATIDCESALRNIGAIDVALCGVASSVHRIVTTVPGGYNMPLLAATSRAGLELLVSRSEQGAAFTALAIAWESGRPSLVVVITSPGVYGAMQALHTAAVNHIPLILLSGESSGAGSVQSGDGLGGPSVTRATAALTAWSADVTRPEDLAGALVRGVSTAASQRRPVHLNLPIRVMRAELPS